MKHRLAALFSAVVAVGAAGAHAANVTYTVDQPIGAGGVHGTFTTDGATGVLSAADLVAWNLRLDGIGATLNLTNINSTIDFFSGADLTATSTGLYFNFSGDPGWLTIQENGFVGSGARFYCDEANPGGSPCLGGAAIAPGVYGDGTSLRSDEAGSVRIASVPEPATWTMMLVGFALVGSATRRSLSPGRPATRRFS